MCKVSIFYAFCNKTNNASPITSQTFLSCEINDYMQCYGFSNPWIMLFEKCLYLGDFLDLRKSSSGVTLAKGTFSLYGDIFIIKRVCMRELGFYT